MSSIWRFYKDQDRQWRWQRLSIDRAVLAESRAAHKQYDECVADAQGKGYILQPSQPKLIRKYSR
ncbi:MAG: hypothetical protein A3G24_08330 [Betaproteobacteria bacterium RIFCSPLOWO2_12_FULL_62_13]|nr:MAG: hypothetical protein A3G24_08330 [Betaproteobacteria bacterium RIFCSPLOWO2_12_FULL_62_13]